MTAQMWSAAAAAAGGRHWCHCSRCDLYKTRGAMYAKAVADGMKELQLHVRTGVIACIAHLNAHAILQVSFLLRAALHTLVFSTYYDCFPVCHFPHPDILLRVCHFTVCHFPDPVLCPSLSSLSTASPSVFFVRHFQVVHFQWRCFYPVAFIVKLNSL